VFRERLGKQLEVYSTKAGDFMPYDGEAFRI
jgi:hypothetical protein